MDSTNLWTITVIAESTRILCLYNRRLKIIQNLIWANGNRQSPFKPSPYIRLKCQSLFSSQVTARTCISSYPRTKLPRGRLTTLKVLHFSQAQVNILAEHNLIYFDYRMHCKIVFNSHYVTIYRSYKITAYWHKHLDTHWPMGGVLIDWMITVCEIYIIVADLQRSKHIVHIK